MIAKLLENSGNGTFTCKQTGKPAGFSLIFNSVNGHVCCDVIQNVLQEI